MINKLEIKRDAIEKFLMRIKDSIKKHKKAAIAVVCTIVLLCAAAVVGAVLYQKSVDDSLAEYAKISDDFDDSVRKISEDIPRTMENYDLLNSKINELKADTAVKIVKLKEKSKFGYIARDGYYLAGGYYLEAEKNEEAIKYFELFIKENPESELAPLALFSIGVSYENSGNIDKALENYLSIEKKYPNGKFNARNLYDIGRMYQKKGDLAKAKEYYEKVKVQHTNTLHSDYATARLMLLNTKPEEVPAKK
jgi:tetratricopeptide (TPR) repeat protein